MKLFSFLRDGGLGATRFLLYRIRLSFSFSPPDIVLFLPILWRGTMHALWLMAFWGRGVFFTVFFLFSASYSSILACIHTRRLGYRGSTNHQKRSSLIFLYCVRNKMSCCILVFTVSASAFSFGQACFFVSYTICFIPTHATTSLYFHPRFQAEHQHSVA